MHIQDGDLPKKLERHAGASLLLRSVLQAGAMPVHYLWLKNGIPMKTSELSWAGCIKRVGLGRAFGKVQEHKV